MTLLKNKHSSYVPGIFKVPGTCSMKTKNFPPKLPKTALFKPFPRETIHSKSSLPPRRRCFPLPENLKNTQNLL